MLRMKERKKKYPSRENVRYVAVPKHLYEHLRALGKEWERSISWMGRKAIQEFLAKNGIDPSPPKKP